VTSAHLHIKHTVNTIALSRSFTLVVALAVQARVPSCERVACGVTSPVPCRGVQCVCEDLEAAAALDADAGSAPITALAWSPRLGRSEERIAIARGSSVTIVGFCSVTGSADEGDGMGNGEAGDGGQDTVEASQVSGASARLRDVCHDSFPCCPPRKCWCSRAQAHVPHPWVLARPGQACHRSDAYTALKDLAFCRWGTLCSTAVKCGACNGALRGCSWPCPAPRAVPRPRLCMFGTCGLMAPLASSLL
jgi:hypothetical protein